MSGVVIVDASLAAKWVLREPYSTEALVLLDEWVSQQRRLLAPGLLAFEIANALSKHIHRGGLPLAIAKQCLAAVLLMEPELDYEPSTYARALELAHQFGRPTCYDAHYLALAEREGCECWTADERLWNAVRDQLSWVRWIGEYRPTQAQSPTR